MEKRDPPDDAKFGAKKKELADRVQTNKREIAFFEWLKEKQREAGLLSSAPAQQEKQVNVKDETG